MTCGNEQIPPGFDNLNQFIAPRRCTEGEWRKRLRRYFQALRDDASRHA